jgi:hypothetical protein
MIGYFYCFIFNERTAFDVLKEKKIDFVDDSGLFSGK